MATNGAEMPIKRPMDSSGQRPTYSSRRLDMNETPNPPELKGELMMYEPRVVPYVVEPHPDSLCPDCGKLRALIMGPRVKHPFLACTDLEKCGSTQATYASGETSLSRYGGGASSFIEESDDDDALFDAYQRDVGDR